MCLMEGMKQKMKEKEEARLLLLKEQEKELRKKGFNTICGIDEAGSVNNFVDIKNKAYELGRGL